MDKKIDCLKHTECWSTEKQKKTCSNSWNLMQELSTGVLHPLVIAAESSLTNGINYLSISVLSQVHFWSVLCINCTNRHFIFFGSLFKSSDKIKPQAMILTDGSFIDLQSSMTPGDHFPRWTAEPQRGCCGDWLQDYSVLDQKCCCFQHSACIVQHINNGVLNSRAFKCYISYLKLMFLNEWLQRTLQTLEKTRRIGLTIQG